MKLVSLLSGGIDSAVSTSLALREKGIEVIAVHFLNYPFTEKSSEEKIKKIVHILSKKHKKKIKLAIVPFGKTLTEIGRNAERKYSCVLCRRMMLRVAERIAVKENAMALVTGESLGQVASQTLSNLRAEFIAGIPVIRPLLGMDKTEIEKIAREIGSYEFSLLPPSCCHLVPEKPSTRAREKLIKEEEAKINVNELIKYAVKNKTEFLVKEK